MRKRKSKVVSEEERGDYGSVVNVPGYYAKVKRLKRYGAEANALYESATFCDLCGSSDRKFTIDHSHDTGKFRGILCYKCNVGLGLFNESPELFLKAISYLADRQ